MSIYAGIDLGTSGLKVALIDDEGRVLASASRSVKVDRPRPGWSQQDPRLWWQETKAIFDSLAEKHPALMKRMTALSISGHMLGSVLLDADDQPTYPSILWNDQRSISQCKVLEDRVPDIGVRTNGAPDPGLTAPKLLWMNEHVPDAFQAAVILILPKDYLRLCLTGERITEASDASGTMLYECGERRWSEELAAAAEWDLQRLPQVVASTDYVGDMRNELRLRWKIEQPVRVAAGAGDNFAGTLGVGAAKPGETVISIGTSGVICAVDSDFHPIPQKAVLTGVHAAPDTYLSMGVVMSATQSLDWLADLTGTSVPDLSVSAQHRFETGGIERMPIIRPSLTGVRTPDNRPDSGASFRGLNAGTEKSDIAYAIMEGVAFQFYDCYLAQTGAGVPMSDFFAVGGGSKSDFWVQLIATLLDTPITMPEGGEVSACLGAARLAKCACNPADISSILEEKPKTISVIEGKCEWRDQLLERHRAFRELPF